MYCDCCEEESKTTRNKIKHQPIYSTSQLVLLDVDIRRITISTKPLWRKSHCTHYIYRQIICQSLFRN